MFGRHKEEGLAPVIPLRPNLTFEKREQLEQEASYYEAEEADALERAKEAHEKRHRALLLLGYNVVDRTIQ